MRGSIPTVVGSYKSAVSYRINTIWNTKGQSIWQRNYYEHVGRDEKSLDNIRQYIVENPLRWGDDPENPRYLPGSQDLLFDIPF
ncbi:MAG: transposase [Nostocaceae cyanobacterium]|nr:transposase [Nostocaceae cyanobacterium]